MEKDKRSRREIVDYYKPEVEKLVSYISWLESRKGKKVVDTYEGENLRDTSLTFPVYDGTLMNFVKTAQNTRLMDRNYMYVYTRNHLRTPADELRYIKKATLQEMGELGCILSRYVLRGMTKAGVWAEGVNNGVMLAVLVKMQMLIMFYDKEDKKAQGEN